MFDIHQAKLDLGKENEVLIKQINLDADVECFILIDSEDKKIAGLVLSNILDTLIGNISKYDTYRDFSNALESINHFIKTWQNDGNRIKDLSIFIGILSKSNLIFSTIGDSSAYLIKKDGELIEITEKSETKKEFSFISNGDIGDGEVIILSSNRLLNSLSKSDLRDSGSLHKSEDILINLAHIIKGEQSNENIAIFSIKNNYFLIEKEETLTAKIIEKTKYYGLKCFDNKFTKSTLANLMLAKEKLAKQTQIIKNTVFGIGILILIILLYNIIGGILSTSSGAKEIQIAKTNLENVKEYIRIANENIANADVFDLNIKKAEDVINEIKQKELFENDINILQNDILVIKKQFNGVESFEEEKEKLINSTVPTNTIRIIGIAGKYFALTPKSIVGPILPGQDKPGEYVFDKLSEGDSFKEAIEYNESILILTKNSKMVNFTTNGYFRYADTIGKTAWELSDGFTSFLQNIYTYSASSNQIIKHKQSSGGNFDVGVPYLKDEDAKALGNILSIAIDGGIYILKQDLSIVKVYGSPKYRMEKIVINKLPKNYSIDSQTSTIALKTRPELSYLYLFMNDKIWIFKPNSKNFQDTKSLTYIGQIEGKSKIKDFIITHDGEITVLSDNGLYKLNFEVSDDKLILR